MLKGKNIILGVTGSIAAYKMASLASMLVKQGADVTVIMTKNATQFITPLTFETLTNNKCIVDTFDRNFEYSVEHVALAKKANVFMVAPASANVISKAAHGIADDMLTTTLLACTCPKIFAPAMNSNMYKNKIVQDNLDILRNYNIEVIGPSSGYLACGDTGIGKMPEPSVLYEYILKAVTPKDMKGKRVLVTAGPTQESIDPVRYITNHSSGKMGYAIARQAMLRGADVTLISGKVNLEAPLNVHMYNVTSAQEMAEDVKSKSSDNHIIIKAAAVADYRPKSVADEKIKKSSNDMCIELDRTEDILEWLGSNQKYWQYICGFSMETENVLENSRKKLEKKHVDMIIANNLKDEGAGFGVDTNVATIITKDNYVELPKMSKDELANRILDAIMSRYDGATR